MSTRDLSTRDGAPVRVARRTYCPPRLIRHGDVRDVTLGASVGGGESGFPGGDAVVGPVPYKPANKL